MRITNPPAGHDSLDGVSTSDHHTKYSDADAVSAVVEDAAYGAGWNADTTHAPSQNAVYDKFEALHAAPSDTAYASSWNGVTAIAPSKNAVYDKIEGLGAPITLIGTVDADNDASLTITGLDTSVYETFFVYLANMHPSTQSRPIMRLGDSGGIKSGGSDYGWSASQIGATNTHNVNYDEISSFWSIVAVFSYSGPGTGGGGGVGGEVVIYSDPDGDAHTYMTGQYVSNTGGLWGVYQGAIGGKMHMRLITTQVQFKFASGNVVSGRMTVYGGKHA